MTCEDLFALLQNESGEMRVSNGFSYYRGLANGFLVAQILHKYYPVGIAYTMCCS